jgi:hypothetical protein
MEPADKAIGTLKAKAEEERETATFSFSVDLKLAQNEDAQAAGEPVPHPNQLRMGLKPRGDLRAVRTMNAIEAFDGASLTLRDDTLTLAHAPSRALSDGATRVLAPAFLDHRALFSLEACAKRSSLETLALHGVVLGAWGAAFLARGARLQGGAGLERLSLVECRLRDEGARSIGSLLSRGSRLVELELSANRIGDEGLLALATELGMNEFLQVL